jgi:dephospho-CoA kinase
VTNNQPEEAVFTIHMNAEIDRYFDDSSIPLEGQPRIVILLGGPASGKTRLRREKYSTGYVLVDAADIFINLSRGGYYDFPEAFEEPMNLIGRMVASRAVSERRNIVTEIIGSDFEKSSQLIESMRSAGYEVEVAAVTCDIDLAMERNMSRGENNISSYYAELFQRSWLIEAAEEKVPSSK